MREEPDIKFLDLVSELRVKYEEEEIIAKMEKTALVRSPPPGGGGNSMFCTAGWPFSSETVRVSTMSLVSGLTLGGSGYFIARRLFARDQRFVITLHAREPGNDVGVALGLQVADPGSASAFSAGST